MVWQQEPRAKLREGGGKAAGWPENNGSTEEEETKEEETIFTQLAPLSLSLRWS